MLAIVTMGPRLFSYPSAKFNLFLSTHNSKIDEYILIRLSTL